MAIFPDIGLRRAANSSDADNLRGAMWILASCIGATAMAVIVRILSDEMAPVQIAFLRSAFGVWVLIPVFLRARVRQKRLIPRFSRPGLHLLRGLMFATATALGFYAMANLPLATATTLFFLAPVFATAFSALFAGEAVGRRRWIAVVAAFVGALIVLRPGIVAVQMPMLAAVGSATLFAFSLLITRPLGQADGATAIMVSSSVVASCALAVPTFVLWSPVPVSLWGFVIVLVLASSLRMMSDVRAYSLADAGFLAPFAFLRLLFIAVAAWYLFREGIDMPTLLGATVIIGSTVFIAWREAMLRKTG